MASTHLMAIQIALRSGPPLHIQDLALLDDLVDAHVFITVLEPGCHCLDGMQPLRMYNDGHGNHDEEKQVGKQARPNVRIDTPILQKNHSQTLAG